MEENKSRIDNTTEDIMVVVDRISNLPDPILGHILSFLPTEEAVATSFLSKRWNFIWSTVHNLDFSFVDPCCVDHCYYADPLDSRQSKDKNMKFVRFVERVLLLHDGGSINKFRLSCASYNIPSHVILWINFAITRNVHELYLSFESVVLFYIPISGLSCDTLRSLELSRIRLDYDATTSVCLPRLESLKLDHVYGVSTEACEKLISGCPVLQYLHLDIYPIHEYSLDEDWCTTSNVFSYDSLHLLKLYGYVYVPATIVFCCTRVEILKLDCVRFESKEACENLISGCPMLQYLCLRFSIKPNDDDGDDIFTCIISSVSLRHLKIDFRKKSKLVLKASSLESFEVDGDISEIFVEKSLPSLVQADFRTRLVERGFVNNSNNSIVEAVGAFDCAKVLTLSHNVMLALSRASISLSTEFKQLVKFVSETCCSSLQDVIQNSNNLEDLIISQHACNCHDHPKWTTPVEVPRCLSSSLKSVRFHGYKGSEGEREMIRYILEHGSALEVMHIYSLYHMEDAEKLKWDREIRVFPRKSTVCEVRFI